MMKTVFTAIGVATVIASSGLAADSHRLSHGKRPGKFSAAPAGFFGQVSVIDGRTLWDPHSAVAIRLIGIDSCELVQWSFQPRREPTLPREAPNPVACGAMAKAWLRRTIAGAPVECDSFVTGEDGVRQARCHTRNRDIGLEMLRVGWARTDRFSGAYADAQRMAIAARYGMWANYVLDMDEWRRKAVDRSLSRRPIADANLLAERQSEISPPFAEARQHPTRSDR
jgi:endonuclease YncB( thermonuclease family)